MRRLVILIETHAPPLLYYYQAAEITRASGTIRLLRTRRCEGSRGDASGSLAPLAASDSRGRETMATKVGGSPRVYDAIVVGVGGMGSAACYHLARRGLRTL